MTTHFSVKECLRGYTNEALGAICDRWQLAAGVKNTRMKAAERILEDPLHLQSKLPELEPAALRMLCLAATRQPVHARDLLSVPGLFGTGHPARHLHTLAEYGFLLACPSERAGAFSLEDLAREHAGVDHGPLLVLPDHLGARLPAAPPLDIPIAPASAPANIAPGQPDRATNVFLEVLRATEVLTPRLTAQGDVHKADESRVLELLRESGITSEAFSLALASARHLRCIEAKEGRLLTTLKAGAWTEKGRADRIRDLFDAYLHTPALPDLKLFFPDIYPGLDEHLPVASLRRTYHRRLLAAILACQPEGVWLRITDIIATFQTVDRNVLFLEERWRAILSQAREITPAWKDRAWQTHEARLYAWMLSALLRDLNMVDVSEDGALVRVTPFGRYALGAGPLPAEAETTHREALVVQPDFEVLLYMDRCPPDLRRKLDAFCERVRGGPVSTYKLTKEAVYRGVRSGMAPGEFVTMLGRYAMRAIPDNVREQVATWERRLEAVTLRARCELLECQDAATARQLETSIPGARLIGTRFVLVPSAPKDVRVRIDYRRPLRRFMKQEPGLQFRVPWEHAHLFLEHAVCDVADIAPDKKGGYLVSLARTKLQRADDWALYAAQLDALCEEPLASRYRLAMRAWSGDIEPASSATATIVRFDDPEVCDALLELPDVAALLEGRLGLYALVVRHGQLAHFKKALKEHGIPVGAGTDIVDPTAPEVWLEEWQQHRRTRDEQTAAPERNGAEPVVESTEEEESLPSYSPRIVREILEDAIHRRRPVLIAYQSAWGPKPSVRRVNPVSLDLSGRFPSVSGYCHLHQGARTFKLAQIAGIRVLEDETF